MTTYSTTVEAPATDQLPQLIVTGIIRVDLTGVPEQSMKMRAYNAIADAPSGAHVVLVVGPLMADPATVGMLREHGRRLAFEVQGSTAHATACWVRALRTGDVLAGAGWGE